MIELLFLLAIGFITTVKSQHCLPNQIPCGRTCCSIGDTCCQAGEIGYTGCAPPDSVCCPQSLRGYCFNANETCCSDPPFACAPIDGSCCGFSPTGYCDKQHKCCKSESYYLSKCIEQDTECCVRYGGNNTYPVSVWNCNPGESCCDNTGNSNSNNNRQCYNPESQTCCAKADHFFGNSKVCSGKVNCCFDNSANGFCMDDSQQCCPSSTISIVPYACDVTQKCCDDKKYKACCAADSVCCPTLMKITTIPNKQETPLETIYHEDDNKEKRMVQDFPLCADPKVEFCCEYVVDEFPYRKTATSCPLGNLCCPGSSPYPGGCCNVSAGTNQCGRNQMCPNQIA